MHARRYLLVLLIVLVLGIFTTAFTASAQLTDVCTTSVQQAINQAGTACANQLLNTTCLGGIGSRTTSSGVVSALYTDVGDRGNLATTHVVTSAPFNPATGQVGFNVLRVQAGLPASTGGLVYFLFGGSTLTNVGGPGQAIWQNVRLTTTATDPCAGLENMLVIQSPEGVPATVTVNGVPITLHSTIVIRANADGSITIFVITGSVNVGGQEVAAGFKVTVRVINRVVVIITIECLSGADLVTLRIILILPPNLLHHLITLPGVSNPSGIGTPQCVVF